MKISKGDSVYVKSKGWVSRMIVYISTGGTVTEVPSHEARVNKIFNDRIQLIEVVFKGKRRYWLDDYIKKGCQIWVERPNLTRTQINEMVKYLRDLEVGGYDWGLITSFLLRFTFRKIFRSKSKFGKVTRWFDSKIRFVCSEYMNAGRRHVGMDIEENETPYDNFRKLDEKEVETYNV